VHFDEVHSRQLLNRLHVGHVVEAPAEQKDGSETHDSAPFNEQNVQSFNGPWHVAHASEAEERRVVLKRELHAGAAQATGAMIDEFATMDVGRVMH
jgi:hypothetical protein